MIRFSDRYNVKINKTITKVLVCNRNKRTQIRNLLKQVNEYKYLGSEITENGRSTQEIISRINQVKSAFQSKKNMFLHREMLT